MELRGDLNIFRNDVSRFSEIDRRIRQAEEQLKPLKETLTGLKKEKTDLKTNICVYMGENDIEKCNLPEGVGGGSIMYKKRKVVKPVTKEVIRDELQRFFCSGPGREPLFNSKTDIQKATEVYDYIYENRDYKFSEVLTCKR